MILTRYKYSLKTDFIDNISAIEFEKIDDNIEFLKQLLQIIGMYNFCVKDNQNVWQNNELFVEITAPNGFIILKINKFQEVSLIANNNQIDLSTISEILIKFSVFKKIEIQLTKSA